jgi:hypothetical protein
VEPLAVLAVLALPIDIIGVVVLVKGRRKKAGR